MKLRFANPVLASLMLVAASVPAVSSSPPKTTDSGFVSIFDGRTLTGWHISQHTSHGTGGRWIVEGGAIVGNQDKPGNGGILITDKAYGDF